MKNLLIIVAMILRPVMGLAEELAFAPGVSVSGAPTYVSEFSTMLRDNGGPLSPFGSHVGLKAEVRSRGFAGVEHYACATGKHILDYSRTGLIGVSAVAFFEDGRLLQEAEEREIAFDYFAWEEKAQFADFQARARVMFMGEDRYAVCIEVRNDSGRALRLAPVLRFAGRGKVFSAREISPGEALIESAAQPILSRGRNYLALKAVDGSANLFQKEGEGFSLTPDAVSLAPGENRWFCYLFGYSPDAADRARALLEARDFPGPNEVWEYAAQEREKLFSSLPAAHLGPGEERYLELYRVAAMALTNQLYAPRGRMNYWACVPTKVHYNWFWLWDSGLQALGYSEFDPRLAREVILTMFQTQQQDGFIAHMADERAMPLTPHSQPPVFGYSALKICERHPRAPETSGFVKEMYEKGALFIQWWKEKRDINRNGLFEFLSQDEGGWDNSPRASYVRKLIFIPYYGYLGELLGQKVKPLECVDLNAWMFLYFRAMARWAEELGRPEEARGWHEQAMQLASRIDEVLWNQELGCWLDAYAWRGAKDYRHFLVLTPHIWFPAFAGATRDEAKAREVIERHLLNPEEFFGRYPIPSVAYNDPLFDNTTPGWTASIWLVTAYSALEALFRFGYEVEARELKEKLLSMMAEQGGMKSIYETYDPYTGKYKNEYSTGGYASAMFGWSSAFTLEMILDRYQEERFIFPQTTRISGFIRRAEDFATRAPFYTIAAGLDVPLVELESGNDAPLLEASAVKIKLSDPYQALKEKRYKVRLQGREYELELGTTRVINLK